MDFDEMKSALNTGIENEYLALSLDKLEASSLPINSIRKTMRNEIGQQTFIIFLFYLYLLFFDFSPLSFSVYVIFITITCLCTALYLSRLIKFLRQSSDLSLNTTASIYKMLYDLKLTLEVYETAIISGTLILPIPTAALFSSLKIFGSPALFEKYFLFQGTTLETILSIVIYFVVAGFFYFSTKWWTQYQYGKHIDTLERVLADLGA